MAAYIIFDVVSHTQRYQWLHTPPRWVGGQKKETVLRRYAATVEALRQTTCVNSFMR
jgi:hypothetical protein